MRAAAQSLSCKHNTQVVAYASVRSHMGKKLSPKDKERYKRTDEVLHYIWDPIGIAGAPEARYEYHSYLPHVFSLLKQNIWDYPHIKIIVKKLQKYY
jgi:hypothetical protein